MPYSGETQCKHSGSSSLTSCPTSILGLIKLTSIGRLEGKSSGSGGISLTWCQGLDSSGSASRRQPPRRACSIYAALPPPSTPNPPPRFSGTLNSTVWTPLSTLFTLSAPSVNTGEKMSFSAGATVAATWAEMVGLRKRELSRVGPLRRNTWRRRPLPPSSAWHLVPIQPPKRLLEHSNAITRHIPPKLKRCLTSVQKWSKVWEFGGVRCALVFHLQRLFQYLTVVVRACINCAWIMHAHTTSI